MPHHIFSGDPRPRSAFRECCWPRCPVMIETGDMPLCDRHFNEVGMRWAVQNMRRPDPARRAERQTEAEERRQRQAEAYQAQSQVYYLRIGDHVKIGMTVNLKLRLSQLRVDPSALLATEPGGAELERERHLQFAAERIGRRENFNPSRRLLSHIEAVRAAHGEPRITTYVPLE